MARGIYGLKPQVLTSEMIRSFKNGIFNVNEVVRKTS